MKHKRPNLLQTIITSTKSNHYFANFCTSLLQIQLINLWFGRLLAPSKSNERLVLIMFSIRIDFLFIFVTEKITRKTLKQFQLKNKSKNPLYQLIEYIFKET